MLGSLRHVFGYGLVGLCALARERDWRVTEWADRTELDRLQAVRLRHLLTIAGKTPYWQDLLRGKPSHAPGESARAQLATLPILTKAMRGFGPNSCQCLSTNILIAEAADLADLILVSFDTTVLPVNRNPEDEPLK